MRFAYASQSAVLCVYGAPCAVFAEITSMSDETITARPPSWTELEGIIPLSRPKWSTDPKLSAEEITNLSPDTLKRRYSKYVIRLSPRRQGMKLRNALAITRGECDAETAA